MPLIPRIGTDQERQKWILNSPPVIIGVHQGVRFMHPLELDGIGSNAEGNVKAAPSSRLGKLYELLMADLLREQIILQGQQLIDGGKTLGEVDFVLNRQGKPLHLETSIKFYIEWSPGLYIGPNGRDELETKFQHMAGQQAALLQTHFAMIGLEEAPEPSCVMNGILFKHYRSSAMKIPSYVNEEVQNGIWMFESEIGALEDVGSTFQPLHKHDWMLDLTNQPVEFNEVRKVCLESTSATMLNVIKDQTVIQKVFVIKDVLRQSVPHPCIQQ